MVCMDGWILTHSYERVELLDDREVDAFLPAFAPANVMDVDNPKSWGPIADEDLYMEFRYAVHEAMERGDDVLYVCFDNGAYMNTGGQRSGATPMYAATSTRPVGAVSMGKPIRKKNLPAVVAAHGVDYVATASVAFPKDIQRKVREAMTYHGARYIQIDSPCPSVSPQGRW